MLHGMVDCSGVEVDTASPGVESVDLASVGRHGSALDLRAIGRGIYGPGWNFVDLHRGTLTETSLAASQSRTS